MTPEREKEIRKALSHYTEPYEFHWAVMAAKDLIAEIDRLREALAKSEREKYEAENGVPLDDTYKSEEKP